MQVAIEGENPAALALFLGISLPALAHYQLKGNIRRTGEGWHIDRITAAAAGVDLRGDITISTSGERPLIQGDVVIAELNVPHLLEAFDKGSAVASARSNRTTASNASVNLAPLRAVDAEVKISARRIEAPHLPLEHVVMQVALHHGKLQVAPVKLQLYDGHIAADIGSDTTARPLEGTIRGTIKRLDLGKILQPFVDTNQLTGTLSGNLNLVATGIDLNPARADVTMPFLEHLMIKESHLTYTDPAHHLDAQATINTEGLDSRAQVVHIDAQGLYQQEPFTLRFRGAPLLNLRETNQSYALEATINAVQTEVHVKGHLIDPLALRRMDMRLAVAGPNPKLLSPLLGLPLPALPPYAITHIDPAGRVRAKEARQGEQQGREQQDRVGLGPGRR
jgi:uncharacterized protein involved in outer membrane biogenesis